MSASLLVQESRVSQRFLLVWASPRRGFGFHQKLAARRFDR